MTPTEKHGRTPAHGATGPFIVPVLDLGRRPGQSKDAVGSAAIEEPVGTESLGVPRGGEIHYHLRLDAVSDGIFVSGEVEADAVGECVRCLTPLDERIAGSVDELVFYPERRDAFLEDGDEEMEDAPVVTDEAVDLEPLVRDALGLAIPFQPLCKPDCQGLCDVCGELWEDLPADHAHEQLDPRWAALGAALAQVRADDGESAPGENAPGEDGGRA